MRLAIIADIHGNAFALRRVMDYLEVHPVEDAVCLGDAIQGGPQPKECVRLLRELNCPVVMGNADAWMLSGTNTGAEWITEEQLAVREWQCSELDDADKEFVSAFARTVQLSFGDFQVLCFHGSPRDFDEILLPKTPGDELREALGAPENTFCLGGHTHLQQFRRIGSSFFVNPGSVGFAYSPNQEEGKFRADPWAELAILDVNDGEYDLLFIRLPYDPAELIGVYKKSGHPGRARAAGQYA